MAPLILSFTPGDSGWQGGFFYLAALPLLCFVLAWFWFWLRERDAGHEGYTAEIVAEGAATPELAASCREVGTSRYFWLIALPIAAAMVGLLPMITNVVPLLEDKGFATSQASAVFGAFGIGLVSGRMVVGFLNDML